MYRSASKVSEDGRFYQGVHILTPLPARSKHYSFPRQGTTSGEDQSSSERETADESGQDWTPIFPSGTSGVSSSFPIVGLGSPTCSDESYGYGSMSATPEQDMEQEVSDYLSEDSDDNSLMALSYVHDHFPEADQFLHSWSSPPPSMWRNNGSTEWMPG